LQDRKWIQTCTFDAQAANRFRRIGQSVEPPFHSARPQGHAFRERREFASEFGNVFERRKRLDAPLACFDYQPIMLAKEFENVYEAQGGVLAFIGSPEDVLKPNWEHRERWEALKLRAKQWMESMHREAQQYADTKMFYGIRETHRSSIRRLFHLGYLKELPAFLDKQRDVAVEYPTCGKCQLRQDSPHVVQCQRCNWIIDPARAYELQVITEDDPALERLTRDEVKKLGISPYVAETADERPVRLKAGLPKPKSEAAMRLLDQQAELEEQEEERKAAKRRNSENQQQ